MMFLPKKVKDLPALEPDSDDDFKTPIKPYDNRFGKW